jgi:RHS repeat-associated protein
VHFTGKPRDYDTGLNLDYFGARYFSGAQGRFTSPDEPLTFAGPENPQSWNLYGYGLNNPLLYSDPDGHEPCVNGINPQNGNICTTVTAQADDPWAPGGSLFSLWWGRMMLDAAAAVSNAASGAQLARPVVDLASRSNPTCVAGYAGVGASIGFWAGGGLGTLGLAGGPAVAATIPGGAAGGAALGGGIGGLGGIIMCSSGTGQGGGGGAGDGGLSGAARRKLGNLASRAGEKVRDVIRSRGGTASNVNQVGQWADKTLGEAAQAAANGDRTAETAVKIAKQAANKGQQY